MLRSMLNHPHSYMIVPVFIRHGRPHFGHAARFCEVKVVQLKRLNDKGIFLLNPIGEERKNKLRKQNRESLEDWSSCNLEWSSA